MDQKAWRFVRELNSYSEERLDRIALIDGRGKYTYRQLFRSWDRYAEVFAALGITEQNRSRVGMTGNVSAECIIAFYALNMLGVSVSMLPDPDQDTADTIGKPLPGVEVRIYDEDEEKFYTLEDSPRTGRLYISSDFISVN